MNIRRKLSVWLIPCGLSILSTAAFAGVDACRIAFTDEQRHELGRSRQYETLSTTEGWLSYVPASMRLTALSIAMQAAPESVFRSDLLKSLKPNERRTFALIFAKDHPVLFVKNIEHFGIPSKDAVLTFVSILQEANLRHDDIKDILGAVIESKLKLSLKAQLAAKLLIKRLDNDYVPLQLAEHFIEFGFAEPGAGYQLLQNIMLNNSNSSRGSSAVLELIWNRTQLTSAEQLSILKLALTTNRQFSDSLKTNLNNSDRDSLWRYTANIGKSLNALNKMAPAPPKLLKEVLLTHKNLSFDDLILGFRFDLKFAQAFLKIHGPKMASDIWLNENEAKFKDTLAPAMNAVGIKFLDLPISPNHSDLQKYWLELYRVTSNDLWAYSQEVSPLHLEKLADVILPLLKNRSHEQIALRKLHNPKTSIAIVSRLNWPLKAKSEFIKEIGADLDPLEASQLGGIGISNEMVFNRLNQIRDGYNNDLRQIRASITTLKFSDRLRAAKIYFSKSYETLDDASSFGISKASDRFDVAAIFAAKFPDVPLVKVISAFDLKRNQVTELSRVVFARNVPKELTKFLETTSRVQLAPIEAVDKLIPELEKYAKAYPKILPPGLATILGGTVKRRDVLFRTISLYYRLHQYRLPETLPKSPVEVWSQGLGWSEASLLSGLKFERFRDAVDLALDIESTSTATPFQGFPAHESMFTKANIPQLIIALQRLRDTYQLFGNSPENWTSLIQALNLKGFRAIAPESAAPLSTELARMTVDRVQTLFAGQEIKLSYEQLNKLRSDWGDLEPIFTLIARYAGKPDWRARTSEVAQIFQAALDHKFYEFKTSGDDIARAQLTMLKDPAMVAEWMRPRTRLELYNPNSASVGVSRGAVNQLISRNLAVHFEGWQDRPVNHGMLHYLREHKGEVAQALSKVQERYYQGQDELTFHKNFARDIMAGIIDSGSSEYMPVAVWAGNNFGQLLGLSAEVLTDLHDIKTHLSGLRVQASADDIVFTTTFNHPKLLLTIGDLVQTGSCQNYRTGGHIETLPGYVMDAGVQGIASFVLGDAQFGSHEDAERVKAALRAGHVQSSVLDGNRSEVHFRIQEDGREVEIISKSIQYAYRRHVLKLGRMATGQAGLMLEPAYQQNHQASNIMESQTTSLRNEIATVLQAHTHGSMTFPASRNGGGIYSDNGGGAKIGDYVIDVPGEKAH